MYFTCESQGIQETGKIVYIDGRHPTVLLIGTPVNYNFRLLYFVLKIEFTFLYFQRSGTRYR